MTKALRLCLLLVLAGAGLCLAAALFVILATRGYLYGPGDPPPSAEVAIVLGASVSSKGVLSPVLQQRVDKALELYQQHLVQKILITGDDSTLAYNEVYPAGKYLLASGVPERDIFLDYAGFDTYSSMYRAREVFGVTTAVIVSQRFHLPRAVFIARQLGLAAVGVDASQSESYFKNSLREIPASAKALFDLAVGRVPKYLGPGIPIAGDGRATWVGESPPMLYFKK